MELLTLALEVFKGLSLDYQVLVIVLLLSPFIAIGCKTERR